MTSAFAAPKPAQDAEASADDQQASAPSPDGPHAEEDALPDDGQTTWPAPLAEDGSVAPSEAEHGLDAFDPEHAKRAHVATGDTAGESPDRTEANLVAAAPETADHEAVLLRHGLITHIAVLGADDGPDAAPGTIGPLRESAETFAREAARFAGNVIALDDRRFGLLLPVLPASPLSSIPYDLHPAAAPEPPGLGSQPEASDGSPAPPDQPDSVRGAGVSPTDLTPATVTEDTGTAGVLPRAPVHLDADPPETENMPASPGSATPEPSVSARIDALEDRVAHRLDALTETITPDAIATALEARIADLVNDRVAAAIASGQSQAHAVPGDGDSLESAAPPDPGVSPRAEAFWDRMEDSLRILQDNVSRLGRAAEETGTAPQPPQVSEALESLEETMAIAVEATGTFWQGTQSGLDEISQRLEDLPARLADAGPPAPQDSSAARIAALEAQVKAGFERIAVTLEALAAAPETNAQGGIAPPALPADLLRRSDLADAMTEVGAALRSAQADALQPLADELRGRGGVLSDDIGTGLRSMKNFWLAVESALGRLDATVQKIEALLSQPAPGAGRERAGLPGRPEGGPDREEGSSLPEPWAVQSEAPQT